MQTRTGFLALLLTAGLAWVGGARAQDYAPPDPVLPLPLYSNRPGAGGPYVALEFVYFQQENPLKHQIIATRGFFDSDGSIAQSLGLANTRPGQFFGNGKPALTATDGGQQTYEPGWNLAVGWRLRNGTALEFSWMKIFQASYSAAAGIIPFAFDNGDILQNTFITAPVFNYGPQWAGPQNKTVLGSPTALYGIWNGASDMTIRFIQRFDQYDLTARIPVYQDDWTRVYGIVGTRIIHMWEAFRWTTTSYDINGNAGPLDIANYSNVTSNNLYGVRIGCGDECRLGDTPLGTFSISLDCQVAPLIDFAHLEAKYARADGQVSIKKARYQTAFTPEVQANANVWWYPIEGVQIRAGYSAMGFFNTFASPNPVNFNVGGIDATYTHIFRLFNGINAGIAFIF